MRAFLSRNPFNGQIKQQIPFATKQTFTKLFQKTQSAFQIHSKRTPKQKSIMIKNLIPQFDKSKTDLSKLISLQTGKPINESIEEVQMILKMCQFYSKNHEKIIHSLNVKAISRKKTLIKYLPLGTVLSLTSFSNPLSSTLSIALPQLLLGNCILSKGSTSTPGISKIIEKIMYSSGFQSGQYQNCFFDRQQSVEAIECKEVIGVSLIGSAQVGKQIGAAAGKHLKISSLHLSRNDIVIIMDDANIHKAVASIFSIGYNSGQAINSPRRILIHNSIYKQFKEQFIKFVENLQYGDPLEKKTQIGPLCKNQIHQNIQLKMKNLPKQLTITYQRSGIQKPFYPITIIQGQKTCNQSILGPIFFFSTYDTDSQLIHLSNSSRLTGNISIFTSKKDEDLMDSLKSGSVMLNQLYKWSPAITVGSLDQSGYGYQGGIEGVRRFANIKTVSIN